MPAIRLIAVHLGLAISVALGADPATIIATWVQRYGSEAGSDDSAYKAVTDATGNVIVAGTTRTIKGGPSQTC